MNTIKIFDSQGAQVGNAKASLCHSLGQLTEDFVVHKFAGGFSYYEPQFPYRNCWPVFAFNDIEIEHAHRKKGIGSRAFNEIADHYQDAGAKLGLLRLGTQGDSFEEGIAWRTKMYERLGWITLRHRSDERATIPLMYLPMEHRTITSVQANRLIQVVDYVPWYGLVVPIEDYEAET